MKVIYCYDAYCAWCYAFRPLFNKILEKYQDAFTFEILSGGMILPETPAPISIMAPAMNSLLTEVVANTGVVFGQDFLWHFQNPESSDWFPNSETPAIALSIIKDMNYDIAFAFASDMQYGLFEEGRDLTDGEAYRHLLEKYEIDPTDFYQRLKSQTYKEKAHVDFALTKRLQITGFPAVLLQVSIDKFYLMANGYLDFDSLDNRFQNIMAEMNN